MDINLSEKIYEVVEEYHRDCADLIGADMIGTPCDRKIWYQLIGAPKKTNANHDISNHISHKIRELILDYLSLTDIEVTKPTTYNDYLYCIDAEFEFFSGYMDAVIKLPITNKKAVLCIETAKSSSFQRFVSNGLKVWDNENYAKLQAQMGMSGITDSAIIVFNKDSSEIHEEWISFQIEEYEKLKEKAKSIWNLEHMPEKVNRSPLFLLCQHCQYKDICHTLEDS